MQTALPSLFPRRKVENQLPCHNLRSSKTHIRLLTTLRLLGYHSAAKVSCEVTTELFLTTWAESCLQIVPTDFGGSVRSKYYSRPVHTHLPLASRSIQFIPDLLDAKMTQNDPEKCVLSAAPLTVTDRSCECHVIAFRSKRCWDFVEPDWFLSWQLRERSQLLFFLFWITADLKLVAKSFGISCQELENSTM